MIVVVSTVGEALGSRSVPCVATTKYLAGDISPTHAGNELPFEATAIAITSHHHPAVPKYLAGEPFSAIHRINFARRQIFLAALPDCWHCSIGKPLAINLRCCYNAGNPVPSAEKLSFREIFFVDVATRQCKVICSTAKLCDCETCGKRI